MHQKKSTSSFSTTPERSIANAAQNYMQINNNDIDPSSNSNNNNPICRIVATSDGKISSSTAVPSLSPSSRALLDKIELLYAVESQKQLRNLAYMQPQSTVVPMKPTTEAIDGINTVVGQVEDTMVSILKKALDDGGYRLMRQRDLDLCSALNAGYLLRLSLLPDIKDLDPCVGREFYPELYEQPDDTGPKYVKGRDTFSNTDNLLFDGRVLVFRRGYSKEITTGRLLLPKLDYLQASLVQRSSSAATRKLGEFEQHLEDLFQGFITVLNNIVQGAYDQLLRQLQKFGVGALRYLGLSMNSGDIDTGNGANQTLSLTPEDDESTAKLSSYGSTRGNKVFKFTRYQASSSMISNSFDLNDALSPFLLCSNVDNTKCSEQGEMYGSVKNGPILCQYDENFPSVRKKSVGSFSLLERVSIQNTVDFFTKRGRRELIRNYFKSSTLVEPAFEEVIVISKPMRRKTPKTVDIYPPSWLYEAARIFDVEDRLPHPKNKTQVDAPAIHTPIDIKVFSDVPMANIEAVLPKSKLIFRPADAVVFDLVSVISFLAVAGSLRFDSPKLDLIALLSLIVFVVQTFFRYSNKYARYDLIVNKFITSKVVYRGPGENETIDCNIYLLLQLCSPISSKRLSVQVHSST